MCRRVVTTLRWPRAWHREWLLLALIALPKLVGAHAACPKVLMFDGVDIQTQVNGERARYWASKGVQGFFLNRVMTTWQQDVGAEPDSALWQKSLEFQSEYAREGVGDNFIKVAIWKKHDWRDAAENARVALNFGHAAALAKFAGFDGMALDLEPYVPIWGGAAGGPELAQVVRSEGRLIGLKMHTAFPDMTLVLVKDALYWSDDHGGYHGGYGLAVPFLRGLLSVGFRRVVVATELTYNDPDVGGIVRRILTEYEKFRAINHFPIEGLSVAPGLWPLGRSYEDKSARVSPTEFARKLASALASVRDYVWIYGHGSAWQTDGPYGKGKVAATFAEYVGALRHAEASCAADAGLPGN